MSFHKRTFRTVYTAIFIFTTYNCVYASDSLQEEVDFKKVCVFSDGGGARGIFEALFLRDIERRVRQMTDNDNLKIGECLDFVGGTSTGSIISGVLSYPDPKNLGRPLYDAHFLVDYFYENIHRVFKASLKKKVLSVGGLTDEKYSDKGLNKLLKNVFGDTKLSEACIPTLITAFLLSDKGEGSRPFVFTSYSPQSLGTTPSSDRSPEKDLRDITYREAIRSSSAAPTYFEPSEIVGQSGDKYNFSDGGVTGANNPSLLGYSECRSLFDGQDTLKKRDFFVLSMGTGKPPMYINGKDAKDYGLLEWGGKVFKIILDSPAMLAHQTMQMIFPERKYKDNYVRVQPALEEDIDLADTSKKTIELMEKIAGQYIVDHDASFSHIAKVFAARYQAKLKS